MQTQHIDAHAADPRASAGASQVDAASFPLPFGVLASTTPSLTDPELLDLRLRYRDGPLSSPLLIDRPGAAALLDRLAAFVHPVQPGGMAAPTDYPWFDVLQERRRQEHVEGYTPAHDDAHALGELACAAACYAMVGMLTPAERAAHEEQLLRVPRRWPFEGDAWHPTTPREDLVRAGALILAEIARIDRAAGKAAA